MANNVELNRGVVADATSGNDYNISIENCNSIVHAKIVIKRESLNIKYGPNGVGKSTIAHALLLNSEGSDALHELTPFKYRGAKQTVEPSVAGADDIKTVLVFDENYVAQFVFQPDEVVKNSFEIFIKTPEYEQGLKELDKIFESLTRIFTENEELDDVIASFTSLRDAFALTKSGAIAKTSKGYKALNVGGRLADVPANLKGFEKFLQGKDPAGWLTWQSKGKAYLEQSENCPFCSTSSMDKGVARDLSDKYESSSVKNLSALRSAIDGLSQFFVPERLEQLLEITRSISGISPEQEQFLANLRGQVETILLKFTALKNLSFVSLRDESDVSQAIGRLKIDLKLLDALNSVGTQKIVADFNEELDQVAQQIAEIKRRVGIQKRQIAKSIKQNQDEINEYLQSAGYKYSVRIEDRGDSYRMILEHDDAPGHLEAAGSHLSFGERNAFALVLFMHHVRRNNPDLVVLDDPVSSFDKTKKFAILHKLFHGKSSLRDSTTLLLTHDIEPAIDVIRTATSGQFAAAQPAVFFLQSRDGHVEEKSINAEDIMTFSQVCNANIVSSADPIVKCIYLRRLFEVHGDKGAEYDVISSLLHVRSEPSIKGDRGEFVALDGKVKEAAISRIREYIPEFDYDALLEELRDPQVLRKKFDATSVGYEKVQIFRIASETQASTSADAAFRKFVNESYHIENEYVMQLNPREFDSVPDHIVQSCEDWFPGSAKED
ncbi:MULTISPECIES: AAA family ATPase [Dermacoccus]|uniref:AAA family ATPase n=1 Tax=Dermacoccus TaxID=57495 RepID=UPI000939A0E4|nr:MULTISPECIES: AAA family ATPase [Dermacoccus]MBO1758663.1 AAA family ATPase [Dermacoccus sp. NHGro5]